LTDALLVLSRHGRQEFRKDPVDVGSVVRTTIDSLQQLVARSGAVVSVGPMPSALGDATAIGQVFSNLIDNSLKYLAPGRDGHIEVGGKLVAGMAHYFVRDNGSGIPRSAQHRLFQVFQRFHPELAAGDGMGLAIVKRSVERHGGRLWFESEEGCGTTFYVSLPASPAEKGPDRGATVAPDPAGR
jgi:signal transduction histidine kinase